MKDYICTYGDGCNAYYNGRCKNENEMCLYRVKKLTNADNIRSMTDEKLAQFLMSQWFVDNVCKKCEGEYDRCGDLKFCESKILEWLQQSVNNN